MIRLVSIQIKALVMLVKFLRTYTGGGLGSINYLLNERKAAGTARVIKGDENLTRAIIKGITYKQKTCFGVLSFEERHDFLTEEQKLKIIKDFEYALLGEYMLERTNVLWVEHSDKDGRLELNFLIPKIDLETDRSFNPYFAKYDQTRIDLIKKIINDELDYQVQMIQQKSKLYCLARKTSIIIKI